MICALLAIPSNSFAGDKVDFTGEWVLNESKSDLGEGRAFAAFKIAVKQEGNTITIERTRTGRDGEERTNSETLTLDGKENINEGERGSSTSVLTWSEDGNSLTIKSKREFNRQGETFEMNSTQVWTLAEDGKVLKIQSDISSSRGERSASLVYDKK
ncbi:MAG: hypothetical protein DRI98_14360 [Bacteroidetes bacterium]|nr:MAG: hypothetical protein DRI98_14360 [Bacteroidota bacterium]